jgi:hypothetical protein
MVLRGTEREKREMRRGRSKVSAIESQKNCSCNTREGSFKNFNAHIKVHDVC